VRARREREGEARGSYGGRVGGTFAVMMARVFKTTGGRQWLKPWGVPTITKANKRNFKQRSKRTQENQKLLKSFEGYDAKAEAKK